MKYIISLLSLSLTLSATSYAEEPFPIQVQKTEEAPVVDGDLSEWQSSWFDTIPLLPAITDDPENPIGTINTELATLVSGNRVYFAVKWPDSTESLNYRPWQWFGTRYRRSDERDDMLALRFEHGGDFNRSMIAKADYNVDVWVWSSARSNPAGYAEDNFHVISTTYIENAAEYELESGEIIFIDRSSDEGEPVFSTKRPQKTKTESKLPSIELKTPTLSQADVRAKAVWKDGFWYLEMSRLLDTGYADDTPLIPGKQILTQIAVFNETNAEHKSVSEPLGLTIPE